MRPPGITPAYAGKRHCNLPSTAPWKDHPRVCGEKSEMSLNLSALMGSPPRMRGKDLSAIVSPPYVGITPAYAGKRNSFTKSFEEHGDHPRVCGEKFDLDCTCVTELGSPPRMRGKGGATSDIILHPGITPAYAGKSPLPPCRPVSPARFSGSGRHGPTLHPGRGCSHCPHKRRC